MTEPVKFKLTTPIKTHSGELTKLELKMPTMRTFVKHGSFFSTIESGPPNAREMRQDFDFEAVKGFLADATGHDAIVLDSIAANDVMPLAYALLAMIGTRPQSPST